VGLRPKSSGWSTVGSVQLQTVVPKSVPSGSSGSGWPNCATLPTGNVGQAEPVTAGDTVAMKMQ